MGLTGRVAPSTCGGMSATAKICGLSTPDALDAAVAGGASHVGLVFFPPSPRHVSFDLAAALAERVPGHVGAVAVFVDPDDMLVDTVLATARIDAIQLHKVTPERAAALRARTRRETWVAQAVKTRADVDAARRSGSSATN